MDIQNSHFEPIRVVNLLKKKTIKAFNNQNDALRKRNNILRALKLAGSHGELMITEIKNRARFCSQRPCPRYCLLNKTSLAILGNNLITAITLPATFDLFSARLAGNTRRQQQASSNLVICPHSSGGGGGGGDAPRHFNILAFVRMLGGNCQPPGGSSFVSLTFRLCLIVYLTGGRKAKLIGAPL